jgi:dienelactone hydrolase
MMAVMRKLLLALLAALPLVAQEQLFVGPRPDPATIVVHRNVAYRDALQFDLYRPAGDAIVPVVVFANAGNPGMKDWPGYAGWGGAVAGAGLASVHYNAQGETARADLEAIVKTLRDRASTYRIDPARVVIWCSSSNVTVGLPYAMNAKHAEVRGAVVYYGDAPVEKIRLDVPLLYVRAGRDVPALNERIDALVKRAMTENAPWSLINVAAGVHGFDAFDSDQIARDVVLQTLDFMKKVTAPEASRTYVAAAEEAGNAAAFARGDWDAAVAGYTRRVAAKPDDAEGHRRLGLALTEKGRYAEALLSLEKAWELGRRGPRDTGIPAAVAAAGAGNVARAVHWLDTVLATRFGGDPASYRTDPRFEKIRNDPAFIAVIEKRSRR